MRFDVNIVFQSQEALVSALRQLASEIEKDEYDTNCFVPDNGEGFEIDYHFVLTNDVFDFEALSTPRAKEQCFGIVKN